MANIILIYSTTDGHTRKIGSYLKEIVEEHGDQVTLISIDDKKAVDLGSFDKIVVGASIRYGKHSAKVYDFIGENLQILEETPSAFFSVNVVARKPEKSQPDTNPYVKKFLSQIPWKPRKMAVFAGKIDYQKYTYLDRTMIRLIMWMTKGPTDPKTNIEFTDWNQVREFGRMVREM